MESKRIEVEGMSCGHCVSRVREALEAVEGVEVRSVEVGEAKVRLEPGRADGDRVREAIREAGFVPK